MRGYLQVSSLETSVLGLDNSGKIRFQIPTLNSLLSVVLMGLTTLFRVRCCLG